MIVYIIVVGIAGFFLYQFLAPYLTFGTRAVPTKAREKLRSRPGKKNWIQVYETASRDEALQVQARLEEDEIECILYEQGKKDVHGNLLPGIGIAVPKTAMSAAQRIISRIPT
uniref:DUF2007 domain-containing protein n=1 Tax=uncultured bacterium W4-21b TaxID=1130993 RepID=H9BWP2_9BACT|nr:hypothetical protein [uncultured bacterium W4-21b]